MYVVNWLVWTINRTRYIQIMQAPFCAMYPSIQNNTVLFEGSQPSPACPSHTVKLQA